MYALLTQFCIRIFSCLLGGLGIILVALFVSPGDVNDSSLLWWIILFRNPCTSWNPPSWGNPDQVGKVLGQVLAGVSHALRGGRKVGESRRTAQVWLLPVTLMCLVSQTHLISQTTVIFERMWTNNFNLNIFFIWEKYIRKQAQKAKYSEISFFDSMLLAYNYQNWAESRKNIN